MGVGTYFVLATPSEDRPEVHASSSTAATPDTSGSGPLKVASSDPDDVPGPLDIASAGHAVSRREHYLAGQFQDILVHEFRTHEAWSNDVVDDFEIRFHFEENAGKRTWTRPRTVVLRSNPDGSLRAEIEGEEERVIGYANVWRPDAHSVRISLPAEVVLKSSDSYRWYASAQAANRGRFPDCFEQSSDVVQALCNDGTGTLYHSVD